MIEQTKKSQFLERLNICLRIIAIISFIIGAYLLLTNSNTGSNSASINPGMQTVIDNAPMIEFGMTAIVGLVMLILAFITRKDSPKLALIFFALGIGLPLLTWIIANSMSKTGFTVV